MRVAVAMAAVVVMTARAGEASDGCKDLESWERSLVQRSQAASRAASEAALACLFTGPDDKRLDELARTTRSQIADALAAAPRTARCDAVKRSMQDYTGIVMGAMGQYIGFAFTACSSQARDELRKLAAAGTVSEQDVQQALSPLAEKYLATLFPG